MLLGLLINKPLLFSLKTFYFIVLDGMYKSQSTQSRWNKMMRETLKRGINLVMGDPTAAKGLQIDK